VSGNGLLDSAEAKWKFPQHEISWVQDFSMSMFDGFPIPIWCSDIHGQCYYVNRRWVEFTGQQAEDSIGAGWSHNIHPSDVKRTLEACQDAITHHRSLEIEYRLRVRSRAFRWVRHFTRPVHDHDGAISGFYTTCIDVQKERDAQEALSANYALYKGVVESTSALVCAVDQQYRYLSFNTQYAKTISALYGLEIEIGCSALHSVPKTTNWFRAKRNLDRALAGERFVECDDFGMNPNLRNHFEVSYSPVADAGGQTVGVAVFARDITARKRAEEEAQAGMKRLKALVELSQMQWASDNEVIEFALEAGTQFTGSAVGYVYFVDVVEEQTQLFQWSRGTMARSTRCMLMDYRIPDAGVWGDCVRTGKPVIHDDYQSLAVKRELPVGHIPLRRHMSIPVFDGGKIVAVAGVGNKTTNYSEFDSINLVLFMNDMWQILKRRRSERAIAESEERHRLLFDNAQVGIFESLLDGSRLLAVNDKLCEIFGCTREEMLSDSAIHRWVDPKKRREMADEFRNTGEVRNFELEVLRKDGEHRVVLASVKLLVEKDRLSGSAMDITERRRIEEHLRASLGEKEVLLKEIHHRVKNNLAVVSSLLNMQERETANEEARQVLKESQNRVRSMALVHEKLYQSADLSRVDFGDYLRHLVAFLLRSFRSPEREINTEVVASDVCFSIETAIPCGLMVNELVSNSFKHAFGGRDHGSVQVMVKSIGDEYVLTVADNGIGMPGGYSPDSTKSLGLELVASLTRQLDGVLEITSNGGVTVNIRFRSTKQDGSS
jgi:PAS domain S-box-containing protein